MTSKRALFVIGNAGHHSAIASPVARALIEEHHARVDVLSVAELRDLPSPASQFPRSRTFALVPAGLRRRLRVVKRDGQTASTSSARLLRSIARDLAWKLALRARVEWVLACTRADVVIVPNDAAFPYHAIARAVRARGVPLVLLQEGVRFPLPNEQHTDAPYASTADVVCAWGERSAAHFRNVARRDARVEITGNPRYDSVDVERTRAEGRALLAKLGLHESRPLLGFLSNPIDDQGFCSTDDKMRLFTRFLESAAPELAQAGATVVVKLHPRENADAFRAAAAQQSAARVVVAADAPVLPLLSALDAGVVLTSTVGLEALLFDVPIGSLEIPGAGHVFDYVDGGAGLAMHADARAPAEVHELLNGFGAATRERRARYVEEHLAHRGSAYRKVADVIRDSARAGGGRGAP